MTKEEAVAYMISKIEEIERERLSANLSIDPTKQKKGAVNSILKELDEVSIDEVSIDEVSIDEVSIDNENQQN